MKKIFASEQRRAVGESLVCTCCNTVVANGAKKASIEGHELHDDCGERLLIVVAITEGLRPIITEMPAGLLDGSNILQRLTTVYSVSGMRVALKSLCDHFAHKIKKEDWPAEQVQQIVAAITAVIEPTKVKSILIPVLKV